MEKSFFEYLAIADVERIHSQMFAWIFSENCNGISTESKLALLNGLLETNFTDINGIKIFTEKKNIDILIELADTVVAIEVKLKSTEHSNQLKRYEDYCKEHYANKNTKYIYLTLLEEEPAKPWKNLTYSDYLNKLNNLEISQNKHGVVIEEYLLYLTNLVTVFNDFKINYSNYDRVFLDGGVKKEDKDFSTYTNENERFIAENQLETQFQKYFFGLVSNKVQEKSHVVITETRGQALIEFQIEHNIKYIMPDENYFTGIQFQGGTVKFLFANQNYFNSRKEWIIDLIPIFEKLKNTNGYYKLNKPSSKAYISISKKITKKEYWKLPVDELAKILDEEIKIGKELTNKLKEEIQVII